jgi:hypothetical protein
MAAWLTIARKVQCGEPGRAHLINVVHSRALPSARQRPMFYKMFLNAPLRRSGRSPVTYA